MAYAFGGRIDDDSYAVTYVDEDQGTAVTKGEINGVPFEGGGGGGDFSTAEVTITNSIGDEASVVLMVPYEGVEGDDEVSKSYLEIDDGSTKTITAILYKGLAFFQHAPGYYYSSISVTGDIITANYRDAYIAGDGTITLLGE